MDRYQVPVADTDRTRAGLALQLVAIRTGVSAEAMMQDRFGVITSRARRLAMYLTHVGFGWPLDRVGHAFGMNRSTASVACRWAEDMRDRADIDGMLDQLDLVMRTVAEAALIDLGVAT